MQYTLIIGNKNYSSWSMRAWLIMRFLGIPFDEVSIDLYQVKSRDKVRKLGGQTGLVPVLEADDIVIWDTLAIFEYLYESFPAVWPSGQEERALARSFCCEVATGMKALRDAMPVNTRGRNLKAEITSAVRQDINRVTEIWELCSEKYPGPWLMGQFSGLDIFFAPIVTRFRTYGVALDPVADSYCRTILDHPLVSEWCEAGKQDPTVIDMFELPEVV